MGTMDWLKYLMRNVLYVTKKIVFMLSKNMVINVIVIIVIKRKVILVY